VTVLSSLRIRASSWIDDVAAGLALLGAKLRRSHRIELVEQMDGSFLSWTRASQQRNAVTRRRCVSTKAKLWIQFLPKRDRCWRGARSTSAGKLCRVNPVRTRAGQTSRHSGAFGFRNLAVAAPLSRNLAVGSRLYSSATAPFRLVYRMKFELPAQVAVRDKYWPTA
jgi:hypothetical protein